MRGAWTALRAERLQTTFHLPFGRLPGPVWTLALWAFGSGLVSTYLIVLRGINVDSGIAVLLGVGSFGVTVVLLLLGARTPPWLIHALIVGLVIRMGITTSSSQTALGLAVISYAVLILGIYASLWFSRKTAWFYVALGIVVYTIGAAASGLMEQALSAWVVVVFLTPIITQTLVTLIGRLQNQATRDELTGLLNRAGFSQLLSLFPSGGRLTLPRALVIIDLDHFKQINDSHGHLAGDELLKAMGDSLRATLRADDIAVRYGGDEFLLLLPKTDREQAEAAVRRLHVDAPTPWSCGIADWAADESFQAALARADAELYVNKAAR